MPQSDPVGDVPVKVIETEVSGVPKLILAANPIATQVVSVVCHSTQRVQSRRQPVEGVITVRGGICAWILNTIQIPGSIISIVDRPSLRIACNTSPIQNIVFVIRGKGCCRSLRPSRHDLRHGIRISIVLIVGEASTASSYRAIMRERDASKSELPN